MKKGKIVEIVIICAFLALFIGGMVTVFATSMAKPNYLVEQNVLKISGSFGTEINLEGASIDFLEGNFLNFTKRTNGSAVGNILKGAFILEQNNTEKRVYVNLMEKSEIGYIKILDRAGEEYYINCPTTEQTGALYKKLTMNP